MLQTPYRDTAPGRPRLAPHWPEPLLPEALAGIERPTPFLVCDLDTVADRYRSFTAALPEARCFYAVKCNPSAPVLGTLHRLGASFEVASLGELESLRGLGVRTEEVLYSNPVKPPAQIAAACAGGLWRFAADSECEIDKIARCAPGAAVYLRLRVDDSGSVFPLSRKFGVGAQDAERLLLLARDRGLEPYGVTFHVGSQCTRPRAWGRALGVVGELMGRLSRSGIRLSMVNLSGGFPGRYVDEVPSVDEIGAVIGSAVEELLPYRPHLLAAEPGRFLVAESAVMACGIIGRELRGDENWLYLDVGAYNGLYEAKQTMGEWRFPMWSSRPEHALVEQIPFTLTGPTCDSSDTAFFDAMLPATLDVDDRIYIGSTGAYTLSYATSFNGFAPPAPLFVGAGASRERGSS